MRASDRESLPMIFENAAPIGRNDAGTRTCLSVMSLPSFKVIWSTCPGVKKFSWL
jgi:hypothetical protein